MDSIVNEIKTKFVILTTTVIQQHPLIANLFSKIKLLSPYNNNALQFYLNELYSIQIENNFFVVFGHDLGGYYAMNREDGTIRKLPGYTESSETTFCNSDINKFICFNNLFINWVTKRISKEISDNSLENCVKALQSIFSDIDKPALDKEENFWSVQVYELSEDFFPLGDARIKLLKKILARENP